jgi:hypothetical protein
LINDGDFEGPVSAWILENSEETPGFQIESGPMAHSGTGYLHASVHGACSSANASTTITLPAAKPGAGPAVRFFYKRPFDGPDEYQFRVPYLGVPLPATSVWTEKVVCLPQSVGQAVSIGIAAPSSGVCDGPAEELFIDDVVVTTDPSCRTQ